MNQERKPAEDSVFSLRNTLNKKMFYIYLELMDQSQGKDTTTSANIGFSKTLLQLDTIKKLTKSPGYLTTNAYCNSKSLNYPQTTHRLIPTPRNVSHTPSGN